MSEAINEIRDLTSGLGMLSETDLGRLAVLRHELAAKLVRQSPGIFPPRPAVDIFAGVKGAPEVSASELTANHVACGIRHHGVLVVRGLITEDGVNNLRSLIDGKDWDTLQWPSDADGNPLPGSAPMKCSAATLQALIDVYKNAGMHELMADYLGEKPVLLAERLLLDRRMVDIGLPWHQDGAFFGSAVGAINSFLALDTCGEKATGLSVVARRFDELLGVEPGQRAKLTYGAKFKDQDIIEMVGEEAVVTPTLEAGDAIFLDEMTMHRTAPRPHQPVPRSWASTWFFAPSFFPEERHPLWID